MVDAHPPSAATIEDWAHSNAMPVLEARRRFVQFAVLESIASDQALRGLLILKGGNALDFVWGRNRSTMDLDFSTSIDPRYSDTWDEVLRTRMQTALLQTSRSHGMLLRIQKWKRFPSTGHPSFMAIEGTIGYALPGQLPILRRMEAGETSPTTIPFDISIGDPVLEIEEATLSPNRFFLVSSREDIVAEKLRSLLQQPIRKRNRKQDVLDIAVTIGNHPDLDIRKIRMFLLAKAEARGIQPSLKAFHNPEVRNRAAQDYDALEETTRNIFIPFDEAFGTVLSLVERLDL